MEGEWKYSRRELSPPDITEAQAMALSKEALVAHTMGLQEDRRKVREERDHLASTDRKLESMVTAEIIKEEIAERITEGKAFGLFYIDLDNFKGFNDTYFHLAGDELLELLETLFNRAKDEVNSPVTLGRMGGDEFLVLMADIEQGGRRSNPMVQMDNIYAMLREIEVRLLEAEPRARALGMGFSIGCAMYDPRHPVDAKTLILQSEEAMYEEKKDRQDQLKAAGLYHRR